MKIRCLHPYSLAALLLLWSSFAAFAQQPKAGMSELRKRFLAHFPWTSANTTAGDAMLLQILVESRAAKRGVEVGTNTGYGAIHMGIAFERTGGHLDTVEINPRMVRSARENLAKTGLDKVVTVIEGDALKVLPTLEGPFDFVFLDALKPDYLKYFQALEAKLLPGAVIVADNVIEYEKQMKDFLDYIQSNPSYDSAVIRASMQKNDGMLVAYKIR